MTKPNILVAPVHVAEDGYDYSRYVVPTWQSNLIEAGLMVTPSTAVSSQGLELEDGIQIDGIVVPSCVFNFGDVYSMSPATLAAVEYTQQKDVPLFTELALRKHLMLSERVLLGNELFRSLKSRVEAAVIAERVIHQDIDIIQKELGGEA